MVARGGPGSRARRGSLGEQYVRGVTKNGLIHDFARTVLNTTEFCDGCFSPDGKTFYLNQQGDRLQGTETPASQPDTRAGLTFAIGGGFDDRDEKSL